MKQIGSIVYVFCDKRVELKNPLKLFYDGSSDNAVVRLDAHINDMTVNDPNREIYKYINECVGFENVDIYILEDNIPKSEQFTHERAYFDIISTEYDLKNSQKPHPNQEINEQLLQKCKRNFQELKFRISNGTFTTSELLVNELKHQIMKNKQMKSNNELLQKNKNLLQKNKELRGLNDKANEHIKSLHDNISILKKHNEDLMKLASLLKPNNQVGEQSINNRNANKNIGKPATKKKAKSAAKDVQDVGDVDLESLEQVQKFHNDGCFSRDDSPHACMALASLYSRYQEWVKNEATNPKYMKKKEFKKIVTLITKTPCEEQKMVNTIRFKNVWCGYSIKRPSNSK